MEIRKIVVIGGGTMGGGIAQLCAQQGFEATICEISLELAQKSRQKIEKGLSDRVAKGKLGEGEMKQIMSRISAAGDLQPAKQADFVIESVVEDMNVKKQIFRQLDELTRPEVILTTNTTSLSISEMAEVTRRPEKVCQLHFFNPPVIMKLVEIMPGKKTAPETIKEVEKIALALGKDPVICQKEAPAGIVSRVLGQLLNEATWLVETGVAQPADIDKAMKSGANHPMGPCQLVDLIGLDVHRAKMQTLRTVLNDPRYQHPPIIDRMIAEGRLGKKSGRGFFDYQE